MSETIPAVPAEPAAAVEAVPAATAEAVAAPASAPEPKAPVAAVPASSAAPVEFYALDRFHALTHVRALLGAGAAAVKAIEAELEKLTHTGPVHVVLTPGGEAPALVRPFAFVRV